MVTYFNRNEKVFPVYAYSFDSPIKLELNIKGLFNTFNNELAKLQANATRFELLVTPSKNSAAYLVDIATGIEIPYVFYEKVQNNKYVLKQKGRTDNAKDKYIKFCIFKELEKEEVISSQEIIEGYIKDNNTIENYSDSREKLCLLYEKLSELQEDNLTDNIAEQIEIVELVSTKILSLLLEISSKERAEYIDKLNNTFTEEIISILEKTIRNKDIVMGMHFTSEDKERKKYLGKLISFNN